MTPNNQRKSHDEDECRDRVCDDTKGQMREWMKNQFKRRKETECPLDKQELGRNTWSVLHTMAAFYPTQPSQQDKQHMAEFIKLMSILYPCKYCAKDFQRDIQEEPPQLESQKALTQWFCRMHNRVNEKLNKPIFDCSKVDERWKTGPKDGRCL